MRPRPGSPKCAVYDHFILHGAESATKYATEIGVKPPGRVKRWLGKWSTDKLVGDNPRADTAVKTGKVFARGNPDRIGRVIKEGDQVSEIKWEDGWTQFVANEYIKKM